MRRWSSVRGAAWRALVLAISVVTGFLVVLSLDLVLVRGSDQERLQGLEHRYDELSREWDRVRGTANVPSEKLRDETAAYELELVRLETILPRSFALVEEASEILEILERVEAGAGPSWVIAGDAFRRGAYVEHRLQLEAGGVSRAGLLRLVEHLHRQVPLRSVTTGSLRYDLPEHSGSDVLITIACYTQASGGNQQPAESPE